VFNPPGERGFSSNVTSTARFYSHFFFSIGFFLFFRWLFPNRGALLFQVSYAPRFPQEKVWFLPQAVLSSRPALLFYYELGPIGFF